MLERWEKFALFLPWLPPLPHLFTAIFLLIVASKITTWLLEHRQCGCQPTATAAALFLFIISRGLTTRTYPCNQVRGYDLPWAIVSKTLVLGEGTLTLHLKGSCIQCRWDALGGRCSCKNRPCPSGDALRCGRANHEDAWAERTHPMALTVAKDRQGMRGFLLRLRRSFFPASFHGLVFVATVLTSRSRPNILGLTLCYANPVFWQTNPTPKPQMGLTTIIPWIHSAYVYSLPNTLVHLFHFPMWYVLKSNCDKPMVWRKEANCGMKLFGRQSHYLSPSRSFLPGQCALHT